jgi:hypothetical protein
MIITNEQKDMFFSIKETLAYIDYKLKKNECRDRDALRNTRNVLLKFDKKVDYYLFRTKREDRKIKIKSKK